MSTPGVGDSTLVRLYGRQLYRSRPLGFLRRARGSLAAHAAVGAGCRGLLLRDLDEERRAVAAFRLHPDAPVHAAHELPADVEAEARAADAPGHVGIEAVELLEDPALLDGGNAQSA